MFIDLHVEPYEIKSEEEYKIDFQGKGNFPILRIGRGSYIAGAKIETSLNFHVEDGCYNLQIGKYCALAEDILFMMDLMHDYKYVSIGAIEEFRDMPAGTFDINRYRVQRKGQILIENDVWIGHGATILGGVTIHNGGVVGAGAVVTKDVPPYAIVAGNPAKIVKYRFEEAEVRALLDIAWWDWEPDTIKRRYREMKMPVSDFIESFAAEVSEKRKEILSRANPVNKNVSGSVYMCIADMEAEFPVCSKIIDEFCSKFQNMDGQLVVYVRNSADKELNLEKIIQALLPYESIDCSIQIIDDEHVQLPDVVKSCDYYVTNRCSDNLKAVEWAYLFGKKVLSGVDIPIWIG